MGRRKAPFTVNIILLTNVLMTCYNSDFNSQGKLLTPDNRRTLKGELNTREKYIDIRKFSCVEIFKVLMHEPFLFEFEQGVRAFSANGLLTGAE